MRPTAGITAGVVRDKMAAVGASAAADDVLSAGV